MEVREDCPLEFEEFFMVCSLSSVSDWSSVEGFTAAAGGAGASA
jgi:hypothetical protein